MPIAHAVEFNVGPIKAQFDSQLSIGSTWSMSSPDSKLIGAGNGGRGVASVSDDGRLNFKRGETVSKIFKGIHDLELSYGQSGAFIRGNYWYDFELKDEHRALYDIDDSGRLRGAQASGAQILDAFVYHNYSVADQAGSVRLGKQVVSWGESTFIQNSINSINPIDVAALRRPGSEIKEALIPVNMLYMSQTLNESLSAELFYQLEWKQTVVDNCGTFFSTSDIIANGCDRAIVGGSDFDPGSMRYIPRAQDREARDSGQFGVALRWYVEELNSSEFGFYMLNYHSRMPYLSAITSDPTLPNVPQQVKSRYFVDYPEDIRLYGISAQTNLGATALAAELSYRPNMPLQISGTDLVGAANQVTLTRGNPIYISGYSPAINGIEITGYQRNPVYQAQASATHFFDQVLGASRLALIGEVGYNRISGLKSANGEHLRFGRDTVFGSGELSGNYAALCTTGNCNNDGFYTANSWGYRTRASLDYPNLIAGVALSPNLAFSHDVKGYGPTFSEGSKAISLGLNLSYIDTYTASISYTDFFGGDYSTVTDRDFLALNFGINF